jgi:NADH dehydrogenase/NADH:ubiquinone oxidoreductase subunit G
VVLSPRATNEENFALARLASEFLGTKAIYVGQGRPAWRGDHLLRHVDNNPNRAGAEAVRAWATGGPAGDLFTDLSQGKIKSLLVLGGEWPWALAAGATQPDQAATSLLSRLELLVVIASNETHLTRAAHQVLPQSHPYEMDGTFLNARGMIQRLRAAVRAPGDAQPAWKLVSMLARKLELTLEFPSVLHTFTDAAGKALADKIPGGDVTAAWGPELPARVISGSPIHESPEEPFEAIVGHQPPAAIPVPTYAGFHK